MAPLPQAPRPAAESFAWPLLCLLLAAASTLAWTLDAGDGLRWHADQWIDRPWTWWGASLVHLSLPHLLLNLGALAVTALLGVLVRAGWRSSVALLLAWPLGTLGLLAWPQVRHYGGLSGLLMAMLVVLALHAAASDRGASRLAAGVLLLVLGLKLLAEHAWSQPLAFDPAWGFNVVYAAHLSGALAGALCAWLLAGPARRAAAR